MLGFANPVAACLALEKHLFFRVILVNKFIHFFCKGFEEMIDSTPVFVH